MYDETENKAAIENDAEKMDEKENGGDAEKTEEAGEAEETEEKEEKKEKKERNETKKTDFSWSDISKVIVSHRKSMGMWVGLASTVVIVLMVLLLFSHHTVNTVPSENAPPSNDLAIEENAKKLKEENVLKAERPFDESADKNQHFEKTFLSDEADASLKETSETKQMIARENAPTQMYIAPTASGENANGNSVGNNADASSASSASSGLAGKGAFADFANGQSSAVSVITATKMQHPDSTIAEGEFIPATLETAIDSDLPGMVRAVVLSPIYSYDGENVLIPAGSRLIGQYTSLSSNGAASERVFVMWNRILTPNGISIMINSPGADQLGEGGMGADTVDVHFWKMFGTASLLSVMGATTATAGVSPTEQPNSADQYRSSIASAMQQSAQNALNQNLNIQPTIHIHQGDPVTVFVAHDLDLSAVMSH